MTGGAGFIGSTLADALIASGASVLLADDLSTGRRENVDGAMAAGAELSIGDVGDGDWVSREVLRFGPEAVFHLAAQADVRRAVADPSFDARVNVLGTINVLEAARLAGAGVVFASTGGAIYGEGEGRRLPFREDDRACPLAPYGASKLAAEAYVELYRRLHGVPGVSLRFANVYGPRQDPYGEAGVVSIFAGKLLAGQRPTIFGDGRQTRDYVFVDDVVEALLAGGRALSEGLADRGPYNVGTGLETSVLELHERIAEVLRVALEPESAPTRAGEVQRVVLDSSRAAHELGWKAEVDLDRGLRKTVEGIAADLGLRAG